MGNFRFWLNWMLGASAGIVAFGVAMALLTDLPAGTTVRLEP